MIRSLRPPNFVGGSSSLFITSTRSTNETVSRSRLIGDTPHRQKSNQLPDMNPTRGCLQGTIAVLIKFVIGFLHFLVTKLTGQINVIITESRIIYIIFFFIKTFYVCSTPCVRSSQIPDYTEPLAGRQ